MPHTTYMRPSVPLPFYGRSGRGGRESFYDSLPPLTIAGRKNSPLIASHRWRDTCRHVQTCSNMLTGKNPVCINMPLRVSIDPVQTRYWRVTARLLGALYKICFRYNI